MSVEVTYQEGNAVPLYHHYSQQSSPQGAFIELDLSTGRLSADWNSEIGGAVPMDVYHGHVRRFRIPNNLHRDEINKLLDEVKPFAEVAVEGYDTYWDGNNHKPELSEEAQEALDAIERVCEDLLDSSEGTPVWSVDEWLENSGGEIKGMIEDGKSVAEIAEYFWKDADVDESGIGTDGGYMNFDESDIEEYVSRYYAEEFEEYKEGLLDSKDDDDEEIDIEDED
jgi:hypothetical protein